jgi:hypothetical protein
MQELLEDINALRRGIEALNKRSLEQGKPVNRAELDEVLARVRAETSFTINYQRVAEAIQPHLATPAKLENTLTAGTAQLQAVMAQIPRSVPVEGQVWGFTDVRLLLGTVGLLLGLTVAVIFAWQGKAKAEAKTAEIAGYAVRWRDTLATERETTGFLYSGFARLQKANPKEAKKYFIPLKSTRKDSR